MIITDLSSLGWTPFFSRQVTPDDDHLLPARVSEVQRSHLTVLPGPTRLVAPEGTGRLAVGDWVLHDGARVLRRLDPSTEITRKGAGEGSERQLIVSNVDTLGIVTSCNADFSVARLERYVAIAMSAGCLPLVVLTKADQAEDPETYLSEARRLSPLVTALALNAKDPEEVARMHPWVGPGRTLALVGSSGVGKTTIQNALTGTEAATQDIREDDARGRHTTTARALRRTRAGGCLIDTPGMRELGMLEASEGIAQLFADIEELATQCRFRDCAHEGEPGCAVQAAIVAGIIEEGRLRRWRKLEREDRLHTEALHEKHARTRSWAKATSQGSARARWKRRGPEED
ncbi:ribosome small subunit-dependent GTPase A [Rubellimicrobium arenae]|uniref:ribosome small subunit-dependent GTPase A n=1 Tax=Rubellimicrobium arenae TaxID=2817372 RepID=UPI001FEECC78|nr:ribosome small subunit-dependent GTPase A [Rubellimicrobium arenae]